MIDYNFIKEAINPVSLNSAIKLVSVKIIGLSFTSPNLTIHASESLDSTEENSLSSVVSGHDPKIVPTSVTPRQIRIALVMSGISLATIDSVIASLPDPDKTIAQVTWDYSVEVQRNNPLINSLAPALGLTSGQIDDLFILAATL